MKKPFTRAERLRAVELYESGLSFARVAGLMGRSPSGIKVAVKRERGEIKAPVMSVSNRIRRWLGARSPLDVTSEQVAEGLGLTVQQVAGALKNVRDRHLCDEQEAVPVICNPHGWQATKRAMARVERLVELGTDRAAAINQVAQEQPDAGLRHVSFAAQSVLASLEKRRSANA